MNNTATTTYTFTPTAGQCATTQTLTIDVNAPQIPTGNTTQSFEEGSTINDIIISPSNVVWYATVSDAINNLNPLPTSTLLVNNTIYYAVNVIGNCRSISFAVTITVTLGTSEFMSQNIFVFPNPAHDSINIETEFEIESVEIYNVQGQIVLTTNQKEINISNLTSGIYMVRIQSINNSSITKKLIKN